MPLASNFRRNEKSARSPEDWQLTTGGWPLADRDRLDDHSRPAPRAREGEGRERAPRGEKQRDRHADNERPDGAHGARICGRCDTRAHTPCHSRAVRRRSGRSDAAIVEPMGRLAVLVVATLTLAAIASAAARRPDLTLTAVSVSEYRTSVRVTDTVRNVGGAAGPASTAAYYVGSTRIGGRRVRRLEPGATSRGSKRLASRGPSRTARTD